MNSATTNILELKNIDKTFKTSLFKKKHHAVINLNCNFPKNTCTGLLGHNGAGKTTAIKMILGVIFADQGTINFDGHVMTKHDRQKIGYMPEVNKLPLNMTPQELLWSQLRIYGKDYKNQKIIDMIQKSLTQIGLLKHKDKKVKQLSKGMARRLAWSLATIHDPELLILDEPFSGLDPLGRQEMTDWILHYKEKKISIILCTHELNHVHSLCDHIQILNSGNLVYSSLDQDKSHQIELQNSYELQISGMTDEVLQKLRFGSKLPAWQNAKHEGWSCGLYFSEYADAVKWLHSCIEHGFVILNFASTNKKYDNELLNFFKVGE